jgi:Spy/CpxP family protein refolding chaperone
MKRIYKSILIALPLALAVATGAVADTSSTPTPADSNQAHKGQWLQNKLGLSNDQVQAIEAAKAANRDARQQLQSQFRQAMADARQAALNGDDVESKNAAAAKLFGQILDLRAKELQQIGALLTPDQRATFASLKGGGGHGHWRHRHQSPADAPPDA